MARILGALIKTDENGSKHFEDWTCPRCGGQGGLEQWRFTGFSCYACGGTGRARKRDVYIVHTPEYQAILNERNRIAREEQERLYEQREAEREQQRIENQERTKRIEAEARKNGRKGYVGKIGEKITIDVTAVGKTGYDSKFGRVTVYTFSANLNILVWKTTGNGMGRDEIVERVCGDGTVCRDYTFVSDYEDGASYQITGTVKEHGEYGYDQQTVLKNVKYKKL